MVFRGLHFCRNYCFALVATFGLMIGIGGLSGLDPGYAALVVLPLLAVSTIEGRAFARCHHDRPRTCQACLAALQMMALALVIASMLHLAGRALLPALMSGLGLADFETAWLPAFAFASTSVLVLRAGYAFGIEAELKNLSLNRS